MNRLRTSIVAFVTLAIAAFPLTGASAQGVPSLSHGSAQHVSAQPASAQADCANHAQIGQTKVGQTKIAQSKLGHGQGHCGKFGSCGKCLCFGLTAVLTAVQDTPAFHIPLVKAVRVADSATSLAYIPPSPPPRV
jgi:hypothetical protein